jgi:hypothetical protein
MAAKRFNGNNPFLTIGGTDVAPQWIDGTLDESQDAVETTMGAGIGYRQRSEGLDDSSLTFTIGYDTTAGLSTYVARLNPGIHDVVLGPEGNAAGKPKWECSMHLANAPWSQNIDKSEVSFSLSFTGADTPTSSIANGDTF